MIRGLAVCAGVGGLEIGVKLALGGRSQCVGYVERDAYAAAALVARMEDEALDLAPVWDDLETFDGRPWCGRVDLITAGFPCQPASVAGKRAGLDDERWLWPLVARIVADVQPSLVFIENVSGLLTVNAGRGFHDVVSDLDALGFDAEWGIFSAADVGATHLRERLFILADASRFGSERWRDAADMAGSSRAVEGEGHQRQRGRHAAHDREPTLADASGSGLAGGKQRGEPSQTQQGQFPWAAAAELRDGALGDAERTRRASTRRGYEEHSGRQPESGRSDVAHASSAGLQGAGHAGEAGRRELAGLPDALADPDGGRFQGIGAQAGYEDAHEPCGDDAVGCHLQVALFPPGPADTDGWRAYLERAPDLKPSVRRSFDGIPYRVDRLRLCGNAVLPLVAAYAFCTLAARTVLR